MSNGSWEDILRHWNADFRWMTALSAMFLGLMLAYRLWLYISMHTVMPSFGEATVAALVMGVRFDLLVVGFWLIPPVVVGTILAALGSARAVPLAVWRFYFSLLWILFGVLVFFDHLFFAAHLRHRTWSDVVDGTVFFPTALERLGPAWAFGGALSLLGIGFGVAFAWKLPKPAPAQRSRIPAERLWRVFVPFLLTALAARGTVTPHHLEKEHSFVSDSAVLNKWVQNSLWAFDKKPDATP